MASSESYEEAERRLGGTAKGGKPSDDQVHNNMRITNAFVDLFAEVLEHTPAGREQALALTKIEEAKMWAVRSVFTA